MARPARPGDRIIKPVINGRRRDWAPAACDKSINPQTKPSGVKLVAGITPHIFLLTMPFKTEAGVGWSLLPSPM